MAAPRKARALTTRPLRKDVLALAGGAQAATKGSTARRVAIRATRGDVAHRRDIDVAFLVYEPKKGIDEYVRMVAAATPKEIMATERKGVRGQLLKDLSKRMHLPATRVFDIVGIPKATAEKKVAAGELVAGSGGQAALGMVKLLGIAQELVDNSTAEEARGFDAAKWLGQWLERPQRALGGEKPADLLDTPTGIDVVARLLGSIASGAYQ
jgi:putative toxin-antitoxin system antitoxin component (TIGR02293 family)